MSKALASASFTYSIQVVVVFFSWFLIGEKTERTFFDRDQVFFRRRKKPTIFRSKSKNDRPRTVFCKKTTFGSLDRCFFTQKYRSFLFMTNLSIFRFLIGSIFGRRKPSPDFIHVLMLRREAGIGCLLLLHPSLQELFRFVKNLQNSFA